MGGGGREEWAAQFAEILRQVLYRIRECHIEPVVLSEIARSVSWHAFRGNGEPSEIAKEILAALPNTLEFRATMAVMGGWGTLLRNAAGDFRRAGEELSARQNTLADDLIAAYPEGETLRNYIDEILLKIVEHGATPHSSFQMFLAVLFAKGFACAKATVTSALSGVTSETKKYVKVALGVLLTHRRDAARRLSEKMLASGDPCLQEAVGYGYAYAGLTDTPHEADLAALRTLLASDNPDLVRSGIAGLGRLRGQPRTVLDLLTEGNIGSSASIADEALGLLQFDNGELLAELGEKDVELMLSKLKKIPTLDGHWLEEFLAHASKAYAIHCAKFFMDRVDVAGSADDWEFRPCNHGPFGHVPLKFKESPEFASVLSKVSDWLGSKGNAEYLEKMQAAELFTTMFAPFDEALVALLSEWTENADEAGLEVIAQVMREGPPSFAFDERDFVLRFLERCRQFGPECYRGARSQIFSAAVSGSRSGTPGEPFPEDLQLKESAEEALKHVPRLAPGRDLYENLLKHAEQGIQWQLEDRENFEDD
jgi:hypothetical protein